MKTVVLFMIIVLLSRISTAQTNFQTEFNELFEKNDTTAQKKLLTEWEKKNPQDPELYTSYFNYYFAKSRKEGLILTKEKPEGKSFVLEDSSNQIAGYLGSQVHFSEADFGKGIDYINKGIEMFPDRLDMRFGKIYAYGERKNWNEFTKEIIKAVEYSSKNKNQWIWTNSKKVENPENFFLGNVQSYIYQIYNTGTETLLDNILQISETILKYYPENVQSLSNVSVVYVHNGKYDKALTSLHKAEKINPADYIVLSNIAQAYKLKGNKKMAVKYYEKTVKYGNEDAKKFAKEQIQLLKK